MTLECRSGDLGNVRKYVKWKLTGCQLLANFANDGLVYEMQFNIEVI